MRKMGNDLGALTGLRFFAATYVLLFHSGAGYLSEVGAHASLVTFLQNGFMGVSLFFILSGFVLTYAHFRGLDSIHKYALARFGRIYPVYCLALLMAYPFANDKSIADVISEVLLVQAWARSNYAGPGTLINTPSWTLSVEFVFYLLFPILLFLTARCSVATLSRALVFVALLLLIWHTSVPYAWDATYVFLPEWITIPFCRIFEFIFGILLCRWTYSSDRTSALIGRERWLILNTIMIVALLVIFKNPYVISAVSVLFGVLIVQLATGSNWVTALLSNRFFRVLGGASYGIYIFQQPVRSISLWLFDNHIVGRFAAPALLIAWSVAVFLYYEQPIRRWVTSGQKKAAP